MEVSIDLVASMAGDIHAVLREVAHAGPLAVDPAMGATVVLRQRDVEAPARDPRLSIPWRVVLGRSPSRLEVTTAALAA